MKYKTDEIKNQFDNNIHSMLHKLLILLDVFSFLISGKEIVITSLIREPNGKTLSYHPVGAAADLRIKEYKNNIYTPYYSVLQFSAIQMVLILLKMFDKKIDFNLHKELLGTPNAHLHIEYETREEGILPR